MTSTDIVFTLASCRMWRWHVYGHTWCVRDDQSPYCFALLVKWEYALIRSLCCGGQSPLLAVANDLTTKVNNNTKRSLCPQKDALSMETKVQKDTHASVKTLSLCFAFNGVLGLINTMNSAIRYSRKSERWKSKSTKSGNCELEEKCYSNDYQNHEYSHAHVHEYIRDRSSTAKPLVNR